MAKEKMEYEGNTWTVEVNHTVANLSATFVKNGIATNELMVKEGKPEEIKKLIEGKKHTLLYAWNVKVLTREVLNKNGFIKYRATKTLQAEGLQGEGKKFSPDGETTEENPEGNDDGVVEKKVDKMTAAASKAGKKFGLKTWSLILAAIAFVVAACVAVYKFMKGGN